MRFRNVLFVLLTLSLFLMERTGYCDDLTAPIVKDIPPGDDKIVAVHAGDKVPFTGQLFEPATALRWANWLQQYKLRLDTDVEAQKKICAADAQLANKLAAIDQEKNTTIQTDLKNTNGQLTTRVADLQKVIDDPPFYKTFLFGAIVGVVATGVLFGLGVYAASSAH